MLIFDIITVSLGVFGYLQQYLLFRRTKSTGQFSIYISAFLTFPALLKLLFYPLKPFGNALVCMYVMLAIIGLLLTQKYVQLNAHKYKPIQSPLLRFWNWPSFFQYITCVIMFCSSVGFLVYYALNNDLPIIGQILANIATVIDIVLPIPQIYQIWKTKNVEGISRVMIGIWLVSDTYRTIYFILKNQPIQFISAGACLALLDLFLVIQLIVYKKKGADTDGKKQSVKSD